MKKFKTVLILSVAEALCFANNCFAATTSTSGESTGYTKYLVIGIAAIIIILILFLGYKMDSRENEVPRFTPKKSKNKEKVVKEEVKYEPDKITYEKDDVSSKDLVEPVEYEEDEESLFSKMNDENNFNVVKDDEIISDENTLDDMEKSEDYGEEFDTSIIDEIDDENSDSSSKASDETMIFNNPPAKSNDLEEKIEDVDPILSELENIDTTETSFEGFSVADDKKEEKKTEKPRKKYTKSKKDSSNDFLSQIEENLKKDKAERDSRNSKK